MEKYLRRLIKKMMAYIIEQTLNYLLSHSETQNISDDECENKCCDSPLPFTGGKGGTVYCGNCHTILKG
jgi:hypothetical protein